jgi:hypothetical protein
MNIRCWSAISKATQQFRRPLNELQSVGYLGSWELCPTVDGTDLKFILTPGPVFKDERARLTQKDDSLTQRDDTQVVDLTFGRRLEMLVNRGVTEKVGRRLLFEVPDDQCIETQIEWADFIISKDPRRFENPAGLYVAFIRDGITPPPSFLSSARRNEIQALDEELRARSSEALAAELRYAEYRDKQVDAYINQLDEVKRAEMVRIAHAEASRHLKGFEFMSQEQKMDIVNRYAATIVLQELPILSLEEFTNRSLGQLRLSSEGR